MLSGRASYKSTTPAQPLIDYNTGRLEPRALLWIFGIALGGVLAGILPGTALLIALRPPEYGAWSGWAMFGSVIGGLWAFIGGCAFVWPLYEWGTERRAFRERQAESFSTDLELRRSQGGVVVEEVSTEWELRADKPDEVWWFITAMHRAVLGGDEAPWALRRVTEDGVWVGSRKIAINTHQARLMAQGLETMGLIAGRTERHAGRWTPETLDDALALFERNSKKVL